MSADDAGAPPPVRRRTQAFLLAYVLVQAGVPLAYYAAPERSLDERFAWRMFSTLRAVDCAPRGWVGGRPVAWERELHGGWIALLRRGRPSVAAAAVEHLARRHPGEPVELALTCTAPGIEPRASLWRAGPREPPPAPGAP